MHESLFQGYVSLIQFASIMFFASNDNWKALIIIQIYRYLQVRCNRHMLLRSLKKNALKEVRSLYPLSSQ